jgi:hypothetical protein
MVYLGKIKLLGGHASTTCGAAFALVSPASVDAVVPLDGAEIEVRERQRDVVVRFLGFSDPAEVFRRGYCLAQEGLDLASVLGRVDAVIRDSDDEHLLWWSEHDGLVLRRVCTTLMKFGVPPAAVEVRNPGGTVVPPTPAHPTYHIGFRYYRLAQATDDLYDAYRNMYLAFEVLLSSRFPIQRHEQEIAWLRRGLREASATMQLTDLAPSNAPDAVKAILNMIYGDARLPLFHAKEGRHFYPPQDSPTDRQAVSKALGVLTQIVLRMTEAWFNARRLGGWLNLRRVYQNMADQLRQAVMVASDYAVPFDPTESTLEHPRFQESPRLHTRLAPELGRQSEPAIFGYADISELENLSVIRRIDLISEEHLYMAELLDSELELRGVRRLEILMHIKGMNLNQPKSLFRQ